MRLCLYPLGIDLMNQLKQDYPVIRPSIMASSKNRNVKLKNTKPQGYQGADSHSKITIDMIIITTSETKNEHVVEYRG